jgi:hypothetical protein
MMQAVGPANAAEKVPENVVDIKISKLLIAERIAARDGS